ncbi:hypothetical protein [Aliagarivorans taiwanensis]|uniref:hypothetical protein n=1 Tax=Aliagarivorans taiwanensis TaxID=561966 RepID=UPI0003F8AE73|nr:hypothetical protein [Aliagarivorans taiwanensis]
MSRLKYAVMGVSCTVLLAACGGGGGGDGGGSTGSSDNDSLSPITLDTLGFAALTTNLAAYEPALVRLTVSALNVMGDDSQVTIGCLEAADFSTSNLTISSLGSSGTLADGNEYSLAFEDCHLEGVDMLAVDGEVRLSVTAAQRNSDFITSLEGELTFVNSQVLLEGEFESFYLSLDSELQVSYTSDGTQESLKVSQSGDGMDVGGIFKSESASSVLTYDFASKRYQLTTTGDYQLFDGQSWLSYSLSTPQTLAGKLLDYPDSGRMLVKAKGSHKIDVQFADDWPVVTLVGDGDGVNGSETLDPSLIIFPASYRHVGISDAMLRGSALTDCGVIPDRIVTNGRVKLSEQGFNYGGVEYVDIPEQLEFSFPLAPKAVVFSGISLSHMFTGNEIALDFSETDSGYTVSSIQATPSGAEMAMHGYFDVDIERSSIGGSCSIAKLLTTGDVVTDFEPNAGEDQFVVSGDVVTLVGSTAGAAAGYQWESTDAFKVTEFVDNGDGTASTRLLVEDGEVLAFTFTAYDFEGSWSTDVMVVQQASNDTEKSYLEVTDTSGFSAEPFGKSLFIGNITSNSWGNSSDDTDYTEVRVSLQANQEGYLRNLVLEFNDVNHLGGNQYSSSRLGIELYEFSDLAFSLADSCDSPEANFKLINGLDENSIEVLSMMDLTINCAGGESMDLEIRNFY